MLRLPVCLLNTLGPGGLSELLDPHVTDEAKSGCLETRPLANQIEKKNIQGESPESFLVAGRLGTVNRPSPVPVRPLQPVILSSHWSGTHSPTSPALLQPGFAFQQRESWGLM